MLPTTPMPENEAMSQAEVEQLLVAAERSEAAAAEATTAVETITSPAPEDLAPQPSPRHDFPAASLFSELEWRSLRARHEDYVRALNGRLSAHLHLECSLQLTKLEPVRFKNFLAGVSNPTHLTMFRLEPFAGTTLLDITPRLALSLVD